MAMYRLTENKAIVFDNGKFYCEHKKLDGLCGKCGVWLIRTGMTEK